MIPKLFVGTTIAAAAIAVAAPASADVGSPFSQLCVVGQCSTQAPATVRHADAAQEQTGIQDGLRAFPSIRH
jgi:hypothetical protein